ncbi:50S ribosomal protein L11 methyltransferase [Candidatus Woesearchaeota archaeon]|nr:50S ribosomal protein L11 methyltransferase [Candidatus Woesearchaeota archaeon]
MVMTYRPSMSKSQLAVMLSKLHSFDLPNNQLEQYTTDPEIAATVLHLAAHFGDITGKSIVDLGCGTGMLGIGASILGAKKVVGIDIDEAALQQAAINKEKAGIPGSRIIFVHQDIKDIKIPLGMAQIDTIDTVIENPPFGIKKSHADRFFLMKAMELAPVIYTFHSLASQGFIEALSKDHNYNITHQWAFDFPLKATYAYHQRRIHRIKVGCWRLEKIDKP